MIMLDPQPVPATGSCEHIVERAHAWLDGELTGAGAADFRAHVAECDACARAVAVEERFLRVLRGRAQGAAAQLEVAPGSLRDRVRALLGGRT